MKRYILFLIFLVLDCLAKHNDLPYAATINLNQNGIQNESDLKGGFNISVSFYNQEIQAPDIVHSALNDGHSDSLVSTYQQNYNMSQKSFNNLMNSRPQDFLKSILRDCYSNEQIIKLAEEYIKYWRSNKKNIQQISKAIDHELQQRNRAQQQIHDSQRREQKQQELCKKYHPNILKDFSNNVEPEYTFISSYQKQREQALQQTLQNGEQYSKNYDFDAQTQAFMQLNGIDHQFQNLSSSIFGHQLFQECADHYQKAARIFFEYGLKNSALIPHILEFTQSAFEGTQHEQFALAVQLSNVAEILADISVGACKGIIEKTCNLIDLVRDPKQLIINAKHLAGSLMRITQTLGGALVAYDQSNAVGVINLQACSQVFDDDMILFNQICDMSKNHFHEWYQTSSVQDKVQVLCGITIDCTITPFILGKGMKACGGILVKAKESINFARAVELAEELGLNFIEAEELLLATEAGVQKLPANVTEFEAVATSLIESEVNAVKNTSWFTDVHSVEVFVENIKNIRLKNDFYKNNLLQKETIKYFEQYVYEQQLLEFCKGTQRTHTSMIVEYLGEEVEILCRPKHIMLPELDFKTLTKLQNTEAIISGGHTELGIQKLQEKKLIKIVLQENLFGGCKGLKIEHIFGKTILDKSIWPVNWSAEEIMNSIKEALYNPIFFKERIKDQLHFLRIVGIDKSGIKIEMFLNKLSAKKFKLKTAYPYWESKAGLNL